VTADVVVLGPGSYEVDGEIQIPFEISTAELPPLESFQVIVGLDSHQRALIPHSNPNAHSRP